MTTCTSCNGTGTEADYVGLEMRCVEAECSRCKGTGHERAALTREQEKDATYKYLYGLHVEQYEKMKAQLAALQVSHDALLRELNKALPYLNQITYRCDAGSDDRAAMKWPGIEAAIAAAEKLTGRKG